MTNTKKKEALIEMIRSFALSRDYYLNYSYDPRGDATKFHFHRYPNLLDSDTIECEICVVWDEVENLFGAFERIKNEVDYQMTRSENSYIPPLTTVKWEPKLTKESMDYIKADMASTQRIVYEIMNGSKIDIRKPLPRIENVIHNDPATIVFWADKTKTVVKCGELDIYDPEKGLAMAIAKKALGNNREYYNVFIKWLKKFEKANKKKNTRTVIGKVAAIEQTEDGVYARIGLNSTIEAAKLVEAIKKNDPVTNDDKKKFCDWFTQYCMYKATMETPKTSNPVQEAYNIACRIRDLDDAYTIEDVIGFLGEALE